MKARWVPAPIRPAVNQIGIATTLVNTLFMAIVGAIALALGLAFGLGGRETAAEIVRTWNGKARKDGDQLVQMAQSATRATPPFPAPGEPGRQRYGAAWTCGDEW